MGIDKLLKTRISIRNYQNKKPKEEYILDIIDAGNLAPSPGNLPIVTYTIVEDEKTIAKIAQACQQEFVASAKVLIVICSDPKNIETMYDKRAQKYTKHHVGAVVENMLLKITEMGLASCWVGAFSDSTIKNILKIPDKIDVEVILPVGYPANTKKYSQKQKPPLEPRVFFETYKNKEKIPKIRLRKEIE